MAKKEEEKTESGFRGVRDPFFPWSTSQVAWMLDSAATVSAGDMQPPLSIPSQLFN